MRFPDDPLFEYIQKCKSREILVGRELMLMLDILIENYKDPEIEYDTSEAETRVNFIQKECKLFEAPFAGKPFLLTLRQQAFIHAFYNFKIYSEEYNRLVRLYREYLLMVARKCGKTPYVAAMDLAEWFCGPKGTNILLSSNDYRQAAKMLKAVNSMREESPKLSKVTRSNLQGIFFGNPRKPKHKGKFSYQNKGSITKISANTGAKEGENISVGSVDEVHELVNNDSVMPIRQALSTQPEPIYGEISTEGFTVDGYLSKRLVEARKVLKGELHRPRWLIFLYSQDSEEEIWQDESSWVKSNPDLGVIKSKTFLREMVEEAKTNSGTRAYILAKDFNLPQSSAQAWLPLTVITANDKTFDIKDFAGGFYISGNDFAETTDLCASKLLLKKPNDRMTYFYSHYWIPESKLDNAPDDVDYRQWERQGHLTIVPGNAVDTAAVADWHYHLLQEHDLKPVKSGYDNRYAKDFVKRYDEIFGEKIAVNIPQDFKVLNNPMRTLEADMRGKLINYQNNPMDLWCFRNTGVVVDKFSRQMPCKMEEKKRIDGTAAAIIAYATLEWHRSEFMQLLG